MQNVSRRVKFGAFLDFLHAQHAGEFDRVASGHYARLIKPMHEDMPVMLAMAPDLLKDQTYFLSDLNQAQLAKAMFPLGNFNKASYSFLPYF